MIGARQEEIDREERGKHLAPIQGRELILGRAGAE